jgi:hypothetical protein
MSRKQHMEKSSQFSSLFNMVFCSFYCIRTHEVTRKEMGNHQHDIAKFINNCKVDNTLLECMLKTQYWKLHNFTNSSTHNTSLLPFCIVGCRMEFFIGVKCWAMHANPFLWNINIQWYHKKLTKTRWILGSPTCLPNILATWPHGSKVMKSLDQMGKIKACAFWT